MLKRATGLSMRTLALCRVSTLFTLKDAAVALATVVTQIP